MARGAVSDLQGSRLYRATVAYDGTEFHGFQIQDGQRTVQGDLEDALVTVTQRHVRVIGSGRTDTGVHARGQVIAFRSAWRHSVTDLGRALNAVLSFDIAVRSIQVAKWGFHPRFDARSRWYRYTIDNQEVRNPLSRRTAVWVSKPLDVARMRAATDLLVGEHDFATFGSPPQGSSTVRRVLRANWSRQERMLCLDIEANAFLYRMVRSIVGTLLQVGLGDLDVAQFKARFAAAERGQAGPTAPASGLCLMAVYY